MGSGDNARAGVPVCIRCGWASLKGRALRRLRTHASAFRLADFTLRVLFIHSSTVSLNEYQLPARPTISGSPQSA